MMIYTKGRMVVNLMDDIFFRREIQREDVIQIYALPTMKKRDIAAPLVSSYGKYSIDIPDVVQ